MVKIGDRVIHRPRVPYGRQHELFCFVTRVVDGEKGVVDLVAFPAASEIMHVSNVARKSDATSIHCWEPHPEEISEGDFDVQIITLQDQLADVQARLAKLEGKPSRAAKAEAAA